MSFLTNRVHQPALKFETGEATDAGRVRKVNEDSLISRPDFGMWAVADGVGGHEAGQLASSTVTQYLDSLGHPVSHADQIARFHDRVLQANEAIRVMMEERNGLPMGSTIVGLMIFDRQFTASWAGDSRIYRIRGTTIQQITRDHSEAQELVDKGVITPQEAKTWPRRNVITRAVGIFDDPELEYVSGTVEPGDTFVLCSDGLTGHLSDHEIMSRIEGHRAQVGCDILMSETLDRGATDNVTIIIVRCHRAEKTNFFPGTPVAPRDQP
ncbi:MAG: PP2C family protein-serine/threonine phosphatase [Beijerinckiaceae bacterium]